MARRFQSTSLQKKYGDLLQRLEDWSINPWRKYSMLIIVLLLSYFLGSIIGMINGAESLMDPIGALTAVLFIEFLIRVRSRFSSFSQRKIILSLIDTIRIGLLYGLVNEGFKLA
tara:strand:+ start:2291 stop:2632 length:342 start_codon:yes stop_codon:yes gene_type:complete